MEICVFSTVNQMEADMIKNALDENKIDNYLKNKSANTLGLGGWTVGFGGANLGFGDIKVMVKENDKEKALEIVKTLFGDDEEENDYTEEVEKNVPSSKNSENFDETQEDSDNEESIEDDINNNLKGTKRSPKFNFLAFFGIVFLIMIALLIYSRISSQPNKINAETTNQYYYYEMFTILETEYNLISWPSDWTFNSTKDLRDQLRVDGSKLLYSTSDASENDIFTLFTNSGYTPTETNNIISDIKFIGNYIYFGKYEEDENFVKVTYFERYK